MLKFQHRHEAVLLTEKGLNTTKNIKGIGTVVDKSLLFDVNVSCSWLIQTAAQHIWDRSYYPSWYFGWLYSVWEELRVTVLCLHYFWIKYLSDNVKRVCEFCVCPCWKYMFILINRSLLKKRSLNETTCVNKWINTVNLKMLNARKNYHNCQQ